MEARDTFVHPSGKNKNINSLENGLCTFSGLVIEECESLINLPSLLIPSGGSQPCHLA